MGSARTTWISPEQDKVVLRALAQDRAQPYQSVDEFPLALSDLIAQTAPRTDPARVVELMQTIFDERIEKEQAEREGFLKVVTPAFRASSPEDGESTEPHRDRGCLGDTALSLAVPPA